MLNLLQINFLKNLFPSLGKVERIPEKLQVRTAQGSFLGPEMASNKLKGNRSFLGTVQIHFSCMLQVYYLLSGIFHMIQGKTGQSLKLCFPNELPHSVKEIYCHLLQIILLVTTKPKAGWRRGHERGSESMVSSFPDLGGSPSTGLKGNSSMSISNTLYFYKLLNYKL